MSKSKVYILAFFKTYLLYRKWLFCYYVSFLSWLLKFAEYEDFIMCSSDVYVLFNGKRWAPFCRLNKLVEESFSLMLWYACSCIYKPTSITCFSYLNICKYLTHASLRFFFQMGEGVREMAFSGNFKFEFCLKHLGTWPFPPPARTGHVKTSIFSRRPYTSLTCFVDQLLQWKMFFFCKQTKKKTKECRKKIV